MADETQARWGSGVRITPPALHNLVFEWDGDEEPDRKDAETEYSLALQRFGPLELGVQFGASITGVPGLEARASFRMVFALEPDSPEAQDAEKAFRLMAARLAPQAIYPFVREALASTALRAQLLGLVLPVTNVGGLFNADEIEIPPVEDEEDAS